MDELKIILENQRILIVQNEIKSDKQAADLDAKLVAQENRSIKRG